VTTPPLGAALLPWNAAHMADGLQGKLPCWRRSLYKRETPVVGGQPAVATRVPSPGALRPLPPPIQPRSLRPQYHGLPSGGLWDLPDVCIHEGPGTWGGDVPQAGGQSACYHHRSVSPRAEHRYRRCSCASLDGGTGAKIRKI
jgi:hypothetical protein